MHVEHHPLLKEFPEHCDRIHTLKADNHHFARLADEYERLDKAVTRAENGDENLGDVELELLKKKRLAVKDELYGMLAQTA